MPNEKRQDKQLSVYLTPELHERIRVVSFEDRLSMNEIVRSSVIAYLDEREVRLSEPEPKVRLLPPGEVRLSDNGDGLLSDL